MAVLESVCSCSSQVDSGSAVQESKRVSSCASHEDRLLPSAAAAGEAVQQLFSWFPTLGMNSGSATSRNMLEESNKKNQNCHFLNSPLCRVDQQHLEICWRNQTKKNQNCHFLKFSLSCWRFARHVEVMHSHLTEIWSK